MSPTNDVSNGKLRGLAVTGPSRADISPQMPTVAESGLRGYDITFWFGVMAPTGTPQDVLARINLEFVRAIRLPEVRDKLAALGSEVVGTSASAFAQHLLAEHEKWNRVVREAGLRGE